MEKVRYGIIGLGNQGSSYMYNIFDKNKIEGAVVSACCDNNPAKIEAMKAKTTNKDVVYFADYKEMLDSGLVDAVLVEVPHYQHPEMVMESLKRDIHVISEKPAGVYTKQVKEMNEFAKDKKAFFGMMFNQRTNCLYRKMKEMIADGAIGELQRVNWVITNWFRTQNYYDSGAWRATWRGEGGGVLFNQCHHQIDLVQWVVGEMPVSVTAQLSYGRWHDIEVEDDVTAIFKYKNGATGVFVTSTSESPGVNRFEVSGTKGRLVAEEGKLIYYKNKIDTLEQIKNATEGFVAPNFEKIEVETDGKNPQHAGIIQNFTNAILGKEEVFALGVDGYNGVALMDAMQLSGWKNGAEVPLPFDDDEYLAILNEKIKTSRLKVVEEKVENTAGTY